MIIKKTASKSVKWFSSYKSVYSDLSLNNMLPTTYNCLLVVPRFVRRRSRVPVETQKVRAVLRQVFKDKDKIDKDSECWLYAGLKVEVNAQTPFEDEPEYKIASENSDSENKSHLLLDKDFSETSSVVGGETEQSSLDNEVITYMGVPIFEQDKLLKEM